MSVAAANSQRTSCIWAPPLYHPSRYLVSDLLAHQGSDPFDLVSIYFGRYPYLYLDHAPSKLTLLVLFNAFEPPVAICCHDPLP